jgi:hypothetical protein
MLVQFLVGDYVENLSALFGWTVVGLGLAPLVSRAPSAAATAVPSAPPLPTYAAPAAPSLPPVPVFAAEPPVPHPPSGGRLAIVVDTMHGPPDDNELNTVVEWLRAHCPNLLVLLGGGPRVDATMLPLSSRARVPAAPGTTWALAQILRAEDPKIVVAWGSRARRAVRAALLLAGVRRPLIAWDSGSKGRVEELPLRQLDR